MEVFRVVHLEIFYYLPVIFLVLLLGYDLLQVVLVQ